MDETVLERVRRIFEKDRFATENGAVIEAVGEQYAKCSVILDGRHFNAAGAVMGGVYFMLADFAFAVATNWEKMGTVSLDSSISFLGTVKGKKLIAEAGCIRNGRTAVFYRIEVKDDLDNLVAVINTTGYRRG